MDCKHGVDFVLELAHFAVLPDLIHLLQVVFEVLSRCHHHHRRHHHHPVIHVEDWCLLQRFEVWCISGDGMARSGSCQYRAFYLDYCTWTNVIRCLVLGDMFVTLEQYCGVMQPSWSYRDRFNSLCEYCKSQLSLYHKGATSGFLSLFYRHLECLQPSFICELINMLHKDLSTSSIQLDKYDLTYLWFYLL